MNFIPKCTVDNNSVLVQVCPSVCLSHLFHNVPLIVSSWNLQELLPLTEVMSMQKVKVKDQRSMSQRSKPNLAISYCNSCLNSPVGHKTKFGSQNFGYQLWCLYCNIFNVFKTMFNVGLIIMWSSIIVEGFPTTEIWALENLMCYQLW